MSFILALFFMHKPALAEYRAFLLRITSADKQNFRLEKSSLDPLQYPYYYPIQQGEIVTYDDTWMCKGRTNLKEICQSPKELQSEALREPASTTLDTPGSNTSSQAKAPSTP